MIKSLYKRIIDSPVLALEFELENCKKLRWLMALSNCCAVIALGSSGFWQLCLLLFQQQPLKTHSFSLISLHFKLEKVNDRKCKLYRKAKKFNNFSSSRMRALWCTLNRQKNFALTSYMKEFVLNKINTDNHFVTILS